MATSWDVAAAGWAITVLGWLLSPIIRSVLPKILSYLGFNASQKLRELQIHILPELQQTMQAVDQQRMLERGKKVTSDVDALDKMAMMLRHAREDSEDIFDDAEHKIIVAGILVGAVKNCTARFNSSCLWIADMVRGGAARILQWARTSSLFRFQRTPEESLPLTTPAEPIPVPATAAPSDEQAGPVTAPSDSSTRWLLFLWVSFHFFKNCCRSIFYWLVHAIGVACFYRDWSYEVVGITSVQENGGVLDYVFTAISRRNLKKRIKKVENTVSEVKKSPLLALASKSAPEDIANKNRSRIRTTSNHMVFGREALRDSLMEKLRKTPDGDATSSLHDSIMAKLRKTPYSDVSSSSTCPCYSVIGIYGVTGSGKTTFARYIRDYIEEECKKEKLFDPIIRIHVSETFSVVAIFHEMLKDITKDRHSNILDREELEEKLKESLEDKRFFLILDDLWVKNKSDLQLQELISPLNVGKKGSKILVTARTEDAARVLCVDEPMEMPDLDEDAYISMFMHYALSGTSVVDEEFLSVGREIAKKLHRSPMAAAIVAGRLGTNPNIRFWRNTAKLDMSNNTMDFLWWSYQHLNPDIRRCFEYCNVLPRRFVLRKVNLVGMWTSCATEDMEDVADRYIQELVSCSFLQSEQSLYGDSFRIHDQLHDLLDKVNGNDYFKIENARSQGGEGWEGDVPQDVRHLFVQNYDAELITKKILGLENLRTLIIYVVETDTLLEEKVTVSICKRLPNLRVLAVAFGQEDGGISKPDKFSIPECVCMLKRLGYLAFRTSFACLVILPNTLNKLHRIQLLDFGLGKILVFTFVDLINLRHIICSRVKFQNIGRLSSLQTLPPFTVEQGCELKQLRNLNKLRGSLQIRGLENVRSKKEALEANLAAKEQLIELTLRWDGLDTGRSQPEVDADVLVGLCPPVRLQNLNIYIILSRLEVPRLDDG